MNPVGKIRIIVEAITKDIYIQNKLLFNKLKLCSEDLKN